MRLWPREGFASPLVAKEDLVEQLLARLSVQPPVHICRPVIERTLNSEGDRAASTVALKCIALATVLRRSARRPSVHVLIAARWVTNQETARTRPAGQ